MSSLAVVFDVDNTLTPPREPMRAEMVEALRRIRVPFHLAAGSDLDLVVEQVVRPLECAGVQCSFDAFVCNGAERYRCQIRDGVEITSVSCFRLRDHLGERTFNELLRALEAVLAEPEFCLDRSGVPVMGERIIDRRSMINVAPMGRPARMTPEAYAQRQAFVSFDSKSGYRLRLLERLRRVIEPYRESHGLRVTLGGQTSFDIVVEGYDKRFPLRTLLSEGHRPIVYFGDALFAEGNDRAVLEFISEWEGPGTCPVEAIAVRDWTDTLAQMQSRGWLRDKGER